MNYTCNFVNLECYDANLDQKCKLLERFLLTFPLQLIFFNVSAKMYFPPSVASTFLKPTSSILHPKNNFFEPQAPLIRAIFITFARSCRSLARSLQKTPLARLPCVFRVQSRLSKNNSMQHTYIFVHFVCHRLFSLSFHCFTHHLLQLFDYYLQKNASRPCCGS